MKKIQIEIATHDFNLLLSMNSSNFSIKNKVFGICDIVTGITLINNAVTGHTIRISQITNGFCFKYQICKWCNSQKYSINAWRFVSYKVRINWNSIWFYFWVPLLSNEDSFKSLNQMCPWNFSIDLIFISKWIINTHWDRSHENAHVHIKFRYITLPLQISDVWTLLGG